MAKAILFFLFYFSLPFVLQSTVRHSNQPINLSFMSCIPHSGLQHILKLLPFPVQPPFLDALRDIPDTISIPLPLEKDNSQEVMAPCSNLAIPLAIPIQDIKDLKTILLSKPIIPDPKVHLSQIFDIQPHSHILAPNNLNLHLDSLFEIPNRSLIILLAVIIVADVIQGRCYIFRHGFFDTFTDIEFLLVVADGFGVVFEAAEVAGDPE